ncbi:MAG: asparagine synthase-related protein, partial [Deltaproteobacteria bacterium]
MTVSIKENGVCSQKIWNFWQINRTNRKPYGSQKMEEASKEFFELLKSSVALRLRSDVAVGSSLSGGLDSSSVVSLIRHLEPDQKLDTFTGRFPGTPSDEGYYASILQKAKNTTHHEVFPTPEKFIQEAEKFYWHAEFPVGGMSQFAQWCVFKEASNHRIKVLLDGQGSDEQLGGYGGEIQLAYLRQLFHEHRYYPWLVEHYFAAKTNPARFSFIKVLTNDTPLNLLRKNVKSLIGRPQIDLVNFTTTAFQEGNPRKLSLSAFSTKERLDNLSNCLWDLSFRTMLSSLLRFGDRLSMAHGVEVRLPFCDHRISEFVFGLSPDLLVGKSFVKQILREGMKSLLPAEIQRREKQGFVPPQNDWLKNSLLPWLRDLDIEDK